MRKQFFACLLLCLSIIATVHPGLAQEKGRANDPITQMVRDGWKIVQDGVLQRDRGAGQVETFVFGARGFTWKLQDLQSQLRNLRAALQVDPTPELRKAIANHRVEIANTQKLIALAQAADASTIEAPPGKVSCSLSFGYSASAAALTTTQGVTGTASANFTGTCGFTGEVYAYSYSTASVSGGPTTMTVTDGPRSGASVTANAYTSQAGAPTCTSYAYASMTSSSLNPSSYTISATNSSCPDSPPSISIASDSAANIYLYTEDCATITWTASLSGGSAPLTTTWYLNGYAQSTGTSFSASYCNAWATYNQTVNVYAIVTDSASRSATSSTSTTTIHNHYYNGGGGGCFVDGVAVPCN